MMREDWVETELSKVSEILPGTGFPKKFQGERHGKYPFYKVGDISKNVQNNNQYLNLCDNYIDDEVLKKIKGKIIPKGSVVFAKIGEALKLNRRAITSSKCLVDNNAVGIKANQNLAIDLFLFYFFLQIKLEALSRATTVPSVRKTDIEKISFYLAPIPEQRAIVAKIDKLFSDLDNGIANLKAAKAKMDIFRQSVLKKAFEGELTRTASVSTDMKFVNLGSLIEKPKYGTSKKCRPEPEGKPVLRIPNIGKGIISHDNLKYAQFDDKESENLVLKEGDILTIRSNGSIDLVGKCALIKKSDTHCLYAGYLIRLRPIPEKADSKFLLYCFSSHAIRIQIESKAKSTSGVNNINSGELESLQLPIFSLQEQTAIVAAIESRLSVCDKLAESIDQSLEKSEALRQSILKKAFAGQLLDEAELAACRREPDWEPAHKLLERIKKAKA